MSLSLSLLAPSTSPSLPDHPSSSSSLTTICISDSDQENEPASPSTPQTPHTRPNLQASPDVAETHMDESQEMQRKNEFSSQTLSSGDPGLFQTPCRHFQEFHVK